MEILDVPIGIEPEFEKNPLRNFLLRFRRRFSWGIFGLTFLDFKVLRRGYLPGLLVAGIRWNDSIGDSFFWVIICRFRFNFEFCRHCEARTAVMVKQAGKGVEN